MTEKLLDLCKCTTSNIELRHNLKATSSTPLDDLPQHFTYIRHHIGYRFKSWVKILTFTHHFLFAMISPLSKITLLNFIMWLNLNTSFIEQSQFHHVVQYYLSCMNVKKCSLWNAQQNIKPSLYFAALRLWVESFVVGLKLHLWYKLCIILRLFYTLRHSCCGVEFWIVGLRLHL